MLKPTRLFFAGLFLLVATNVFAFGQTEADSLYKAANKQGICMEKPKTKSGLFVCEFTWHPGYKPSLDVHLTYSQPAKKREGAKDKEPEDVRLHISVYDLATPRSESKRSYLDGSFPGKLKIREGESQRLFGLGLQPYIDKLNELKP